MFLVVPSVVRVSVDRSGVIEEPRRIRGSLSRFRLRGSGIRLYAFREGASFFRAWRDECPRHLTWRVYRSFRGNAESFVGIVTFSVV